MMNIAHLTSKMVQSNISRQVEPKICSIDGPMTVALFRHLNPRKFLGGTYLGLARCRQVLPCRVTYSGKLARENTPGMTGQQDQ